jgi:hypothetical protein
LLYCDHEYVLNNKIIAEEMKKRIRRHIKEDLKGKRHEKARNGKNGAKKKGQEQEL